MRMLPILLMATSMVATSPAMSSATKHATPARAAPTGRTETDLSRGWRFRFGAADATAPLANVDDGGWERISLPHSWNRVGAYSLTRPASTDNRQGVAWYRLHLMAPAAAADRRQYLDFAGVGNIAEIWVNGVRIGAHRGAYTRFRFDVTAAWKPGSSNLIAVRADNSKPGPGSSTGETLPLAGDFFIFGGIYRGVKLVTTGPVGFDLLDHGGPGVYAHATKADATAADVEVLSRLRNAGSATRQLTATTMIVDAAGRPVARGSMPVSIAAGATGEVRQSLSLTRPHLWNGRADPYLYSVVVTLRDGARALDRVTQPLGLRSFRFDADQGFFLNGEHVALHGVSRHQDRLGKGYALSREDHAEDMRMIAEIGANTVRGAHYPHADAWYDEADRYGMVMWAEVPYVSASSFDGTDGTPATFDNAREQATELVRQQYNHPSIMMWSAGNEVDASVLFLKTAKQARGLALLQTVAGVLKSEDPTRPTTFADCCEDTVFGRPGGQQLTGVTDLTGYNRYYGWYYGKPSDNGPALDKLHAKHPTIPMSISEYGAGGAITQHTDNALGAPVASFSRPQPEEYESWYHEETYKAFKVRPYLFATWVWNMFDFASDLREEGDSIDLNDKGLVTYDRKTRKDAFYFYQANWSDTPMIHLTGKRYIDRAYPVTDIRAYSNADSASLSINGRAIGRVTCPNRVCVWKQVALAPGANAVRVRAVAKGVAVVDQGHWVAPNPRAGLSMRLGTLVGGVAADGRRFGSDNWGEGGSAVGLNAALPGAKPAPRKTVAGTPDPWMFETYRSGAAKYVLPVPDGRWVLVVHSFEPSAAMVDRRSFAIKIDGVPAVDGFNPGKAAGGVLKAADCRVPVTVHGGKLSIEFVEQGGAPIVAAIELRPA